MAIDLTVRTPTQAVIQLAMQNQGDLRKVSMQIASGNRNDDFKGFAQDGTTEQFVDLKSQIDDIKAFTRSNILAISRSQVASETVSQIQDVAAKFSQDLTRRRNSASGEIIDMSTIGQYALDEILGKLNIKFDGRFLFSGSKTNTAPVDNIDSPNLDVLDQSTAAYYVGDNDIPTVRASETQDVEYGVTADDEAFQDLIGAIHLAMRGHNNDNDADLARAVDMLNDAVQGLTTVRAKVQSATESIKDINFIHASVEVLISEKLINVSQTDIVEATTRMSEIEATVQATYIAFQRLSNLRLANFLS